MQGWQGHTTMATRARQGASFVHGLRAQQACQGTCCTRGRHARSPHGSCIKTCQRYEAIGVDQVLLIMQTETIPHDKVMGSVEKFGKEVIPAFQGPTAAPRVAATVSGSVCRRRHAGMGEGS